MSDTKTLTRDELITKPPKRWRNWWRADVRQISQVLDASGRETGDEQIREAGEIWVSLACFDTKLEAEVRAREILLDAADEATVFDCPPLLAYLGAYPEGEQP